MSEIQVYENPVENALQPSAIKAQVNLIQSVMKDVMKEDEHYGKIPGCGNKPTLLKAGAEKLIMTFRLVPDIEEIVVEMPRDHREYRIKVRMYSQSQIYLGSGVGSCSTMEGKFRYRTGQTELTDKPVPQSYWTMRKEDPEKALQLIGGKGHTTKKGDDKKWYIAIQGEKMEHDNPADYYNTCLKMGKKRAMVDALLTVTAASDIFTQDIEDMPEVLPAKKPETAPESTQKPDTGSDKGQSEESHAGTEKLATAPQIKAINSMFSQLKCNDDLERHVRASQIIGQEQTIASFKDLTMKQASQIIERLNEEIKL